MDENQILREENERLKQEKLLREVLEKEREVSDRNYAIKLVEKIVFALVGLLLVAVIGAIIKLILV